MSPEQFDDFMALAFREAQLAFEEGEVPVGAVVVHEGRVVGRGHNRTVALKDASAHAEMVALSAAYNHFDDWRLENCFLFSTLEPCAMCAGAAVLSRIHTIVYGAPDIRFGGCTTLFSIPTEPKLNHRCRIVGGVMEREISVLMRDFFQQVRKNKERIQ